MSRVRGGHNFSLLRFGNEIITSHSDIFDVIIVLNDETIELHRNKLKDDGFILNLSEKHQIPVIILSDQYLADTSVCGEPLLDRKVDIDVVRDLISEFI